jgi:hypothetical protein
VLLYTGTTITKGKREKRDDSEKEQAIKIGRTGEGTMGKGQQGVHGKGQ